MNLSRIDEPVLNESILSSIDGSVALNLDPRTPANDSLFEHLLEAAPDAIVIIDSKGRVVLANQMAKNMFGYTNEELVGRLVEFLLPPSLRPEHARKRRQYLSNPSLRRLGTEQELTAMDKNGRQFPVEISLSPYRTNSKMLVTAIIRDVSERNRYEEKLKTVLQELKSANARLQELVNVDPLTEVLNRRGLEQALLREINLCQRQGTQLTAALVDLDNFKLINDRRGHAAGDMVLRLVADRIKSSLRSSDIFGRTGGDEFVILMPSTNLANGAQVMERVRAKVADEHLAIGNGAFTQTVSCGVVPLSLKTCSLEEILLLTKSALKISKSSGKNRVSVGDSVCTSAAPLTRDLEHILHTVSLRDGLYAVSQPIYRLETSEIAACELLIRGPAGPLEVPVDIFRVARESDLSVTVDLACLRACVAKSNEIKTASQFHFNLLPSTLNQLEVAEIISMIPVKRNNCVYCIELSEQQFVTEPSSLQWSIKELKSAGLKIALDNVCFGRSSLEALILLEPDIVKLDIHYVRGLATDQRKQRVVSRLVKTARALGATMVAEGVEAHADLETLKEIGIEYGQGFYWGMPC